MNITFKLNRGKERLLELSLCCVIFLVWHLLAFLDALEKLSTSLEFEFVNAQKDHYVTIQKMRVWKKILNLQKMRKGAFFRPIPYFYKLN